MLPNFLVENYIFKDKKVVFNAGAGTIVDRTI